MGESRRDEGLVRAVGPWGLAASIVNMVVGAGIFAVPASLAASVGPYAPIAFVVCAIAIGSIAICFAEGGSRVPTSGGAYGYVEVAFGPLVAYATGTLLWFSDLLACGGVAAALSDVVSSLFAPEWRAPVRVAVVLGAVGTIAMINIGGVARGSRFVSIATVVKLIPLAIFVIVGATAMNGANFAVPTEVDTSGIGRALILALFAFTGMEVSLCASGEVARPTRTIPRALLIAMLSVTLLYVAIQVVAQGVLGPALATSTVPLADAMARINPALRLLLLAGAAVSMLGWLGSDILGTPRILFAFARDGLMPSVLGRVHPRSHAPHVAIICYAILAVVLALSGTFAELAVLSTLTVTVPYIAGCAAAWRLARRGVALAGEPLGFRWLGPAAAVGIFSSIGLVALASPNEILGFAAAIAIAVAIYLIQTRVMLSRS
jgi:APA family basic amino acid/polyamine antiporter